MIKSYKDKQTEVVANGLAVRKLPQDMQRAALRKLRQLGAVDLPLSNRTPGAPYHLAVQVRSRYEGMLIALPVEHWPA